MGIRSAFRFASKVAAGGQDTSVTRTPIRSPWSSTSLSKIVWSDVFGQSAGLPSRAEAMRVPSIAKGRGLIVGTLSRQPLALFEGETKVNPAPWMHRTDTTQNPRVRMLWTLDDLIFAGVSLWAVDRTPDGTITDAIRVAPEAWQITQDLTVLVDGDEVDPSQVILFEGPQDPLLEIAAETIGAARAMEAAWRDRVEHPLPPTHFEGTDPNAAPTEDEVRAMLTEWDDRRRAGGSAYTPPGVKANYPQAQSADLFVNGRNAARLDVANFLGLPGALLDGSTSTASLTYSTQETSRNELVDLSLAFWATPVEARLSQDDVVAPGQRVAFDLAYLSTPIQPEQGPAMED